MIEKLLTDPSASTEEIQDARRYFTFELDIRDKDGRIRSTLSSRTGTGPGGEGQLPFYIAIGASLAATYLNKRTEKMGPPTSDTNAYFAAEVEGRLQPMAGVQLSEECLSDQGPKSATKEPEIRGAEELHGRVDLIVEFAVGELEDLGFIGRQPRRFDR